MIDLLPPRTDTTDQFPGSTNEFSNRSRVQKHHNLRCDMRDPQVLSIEIGEFGDRLCLYDK